MVYKNKKIKYKLLEIPIPKWYIIIIKQHKKLSKEK